jgi:chromosome segregation ATPase
MTHKQAKKLTIKEIENLLGQQTSVILGAVDEKVGTLEKRFDIIDREAMGLRKRLDRMEIRINQKIDRLTTTLDKFLKRMTDLEDEFIVMKEDLKRVKAVLKEKLGVALD